MLKSPRKALKLSSRIAELETISYLCHDLRIMGNLRRSHERKGGRGARLCVWSQEKEFATRVSWLPFLKAGAKWFTIMLILLSISGRLSTKSPNAKHYDSLLLLHAR
jgi:hypothetical protein